MLVVLLNFLTIIHVKQSHPAAAAVKKRRGRKLSSWNQTQEETDHAGPFLNA